MNLTLRYLQYRLFLLLCSTGQLVHILAPFHTVKKKMKKLFSKIETKIDPSQKESKGGQSLVGKVFQVGKQNAVTVEDIIAEGNCSCCLCDEC